MANDVAPDADESSGSGNTGHDRRPSGEPGAAAPGDRMPPPAGHEGQTDSSGEQAVPPAFSFYAKPMQASVDMPKHRKPHISEIAALGRITPTSSPPLEPDPKTLDPLTKPRSPVDDQIGLPEELTLHEHLKVPPLEIPKAPPLEDLKALLLKDLKVPPLEDLKVPPLEIAKVRPLEIPKAPPLEFSKAPLLEIKPPPPAGYSPRKRDWGGTGIRTYVVAKAPVYGLHCEQVKFGNSTVSKVTRDYVCVLYLPVIPLGLAARLNGGRRIDTTAKDLDLIFSVIRGTYGTREADWERRFARVKRSRRWVVSMACLGAIIGAAAGLAIWAGWGQAAVPAMLIATLLGTGITNALFLSWLKG